ASSLRERDEAGDRHRTLDHGLQFIADLNILYIARGRSADLLGLVVCENLCEVLARIAHRGPLLHLLILGPALARGVAFGAEAPAIALGDQLTILIVEFASIDLLNRAPGEARLMLDQILQPHPGREGVAEQHRA